MVWFNALGIGGEHRLENNLEKHLENASLLARTHCNGRTNVGIA